MCFGWGERGDTAQIMQVVRPTTQSTVGLSSGESEFRGDRERRDVAFREENC